MQIMFMTCIKLHRYLQQTGCHYMFGFQGHFIFIKFTKFYVLHKSPKSRSIKREKVIGFVQTITPIIINIGVFSLSNQNKYLF